MHDEGTVVLHDGSTITADRAFLAAANGLAGACYDRTSASQLPTADCIQQALDGKTAQSVSAAILNLNLRPAGG